MITLHAKCLTQKTQQKIQTKNDFMSNNDNNSNGDMRALVLANREHVHL